MTTITIEREVLDEIVELFDSAITARFPHEILRDLRAALAAPETAPELSQHDDLDKVATARYKVVKSKSTIWPCSVVAGDGEQELFSGSESTCKHVARKLTGAFLDGAFYSQSTATLQSATASEQPSWHDAPTVPGLWWVAGTAGIFHIDEAALPIYKGSAHRWFGPIPPDSGDKS